MSNTIEEATPRFHIPQPNESGPESEKPIDAKTAAREFLAGKELEQLNIPKPVYQQLTVEEQQVNDSIRECRAKLLDYDADELRLALLKAVTNKALDNESRLNIIKEIKKGEEELTDDDYPDTDALEIENARELIVKTIIKPAELIKGILYQGGKMSYNAPSKMGKTWSLLHLGISISEGMDWFGYRTTKAKVLFINPELQNFSFEDRIQHIARNLSGPVTLENFDYLTRRGKKMASDQLLPLLEKKIKAGQYGAIILDSIYKLYPKQTEENSSSDIGRFLNGLEKLANDTGAAIIYSHHYSKGNQASKAAIDRSSGAGAWGRDPDTIVSVTEHEKENCYTVEFNLRDFKPVEPVTIMVNWPNVVRDTTANPKSLKTTQYAAKYTNTDILKLISVKAYTTTELQKELKEELGMASGTFYALWRDVKKMPGVSEDKDKRWFYNIPACDPANN